MTSPLTADDMAKSLTGYDQLAITRAFGESLAQMAQTDPDMVVRGLIFVDRRRDAVKDPAAHREAMDLPLGEVRGYFTGTPEPMPEAPVTAEGKDSSG